MDGWVWSNGGMVLTQKGSIAGRKTSPSAYLPTVNPTQTVPALRGLTVSSHHIQTNKQTNKQTNALRNSDTQPIKPKNTAGDISFPPPWKWDLRFRGILCGVASFSDVSVQPIERFYFSMCLKNFKRKRQVLILRKTALENNKQTGTIWLLSGVLSDALSGVLSYVLSGYYRFII